MVALFTGRQEPLWNENLYHLLLVGFLTWDGDLRVEVASEQWQVDLICVRSTEYMH